MGVRHKEQGPSINKTKMTTQEQRLGLQALQIMNIRPMYSVEEGTGSGLLPETFVTDFSADEAGVLRSCFPLAAFLPCPVSSNFVEVQSLRIAIRYSRLHLWASVLPPLRFHVVMVCMPSDRLLCGTRRARLRDLIALPILTSSEQERRCVFGKRAVLAW